MIKITLYGKAYDVLRAEAQARNVTIAMLARAILANVIMTDDIDRAIKGVDLDNFGKRPSKNAKPRGKASRYEWHGVKMGLPKIAELCGIPYKTISRRLELGWSFERATTEAILPHALRGGNQMSVEVDGETVNLTEAAKRFGIHPSTVSNRLRRGIPLKAALSMKPKSRRHG